MRWLNGYFGVILLAAVASTGVSQKVTATAMPTIEARRMIYPGGQAQFGDWKPYPVQRLQNLKLSAKDKADANEDMYGGRTDRKALTATGFFRTEKVNGRWWMVDPLGHLYLHVAVVDLQPGPSLRTQVAQKKQFGDSAAWMIAAHQQLLDNGFHGAGAWSSVELLRKSSLQPTHPLAYTLNLDVMMLYGQHRGGVHPMEGHQGYPADTIFVFDPEFPAFVEKFMAKVEKYRDDPNLIGYFSDNEIPLYRKNLDGFLSLPPDDPGHKAAAAWMAEQNATGVTDDLRVKFLEFEANRYFQTVTEALHRHDPNHMYLGCRYTSQQLLDPELFQAVGKYAGAVSINYYSGWTPTPDDMAMWEQQAGKPFMITEFYVKGEDSGLPNHTGAGWLVHTQADRGAFYQNFVLALEASDSCVGWHWFKYQDNDPSDPKAELSNRDSNKGIVDVEYKPYSDLLAAMKTLNARIYQVADRFDSEPQR